MARVFTCGFELQSDSTGNKTESAEFFSNYRNSTNSVCLINTTVKNPGGGLASLRCFSASAVARSLWGGLDSSPSTVYSSFYLRVDTYPSANTNIAMLVSDNSGLYSPAYVRLTTAGKLQLCYSSTSSTSNTQVGSDSVALTTATWYNIQLYAKYNSSSSVDNELRINGVTVASGSSLSVTGSTATTIGGLEIGLSIDDGTTVTGDWYFDDIVVNDTTGSYENTWPGTQIVTCIRPSSAGSTNTWLKTDLTTAGDSNNYTLVDETTPNDATDFIGSKTQNQEDMYKTGISVLSTENIKVVAVGYRHKGSGSGGGAFMGAKLQAQVRTGTIKQGAEITPTSNTEWRTNSNTASSATATNIYRPYPIYMYVQPDDTTPWTISDLNDLYIGIKATAASSTKFETVTAVWAMISAIPNKAYPNNYQFVRVGNGSGTGERIK